MENKRTIDDILIELAEAMESPIKENKDKKFELAIIKDLKDVENIQEYLFMLMGLDMKRYFGAANDAERDRLKGAFSRTAYLSGLISAASKAKVTKEDLSGKRKDLQ